MKQISTLLSLFLGVLLYFSTFDSAFAQRRTRSILFIGNSYTFYNDLPVLVQRLALAAGDTLIIDSHTPGGSTFQQHSANPVVLNKIQSRRWDYVVLQEQSQLPSFPLGQTEVQVFPFAQTLVNQIKANDSCTTVLFYMTWGRKFGDTQNCGFYPPVCTYEGMQQRLSFTYRELARRNRAVVVPVGMSWRASIQNDPNVNLYDADNSHPSLHGSYLAATTFYSVIYGRTSVGLNFFGGLPQPDATRLQTIGSQIVLDSLSTWRANVPNLRAGYTFQQTQNTNEIRFTNTSRDAIRYRWSFGDTAIGVSTAQNPVYEYRRPGNYTVRLIADNGCQTDTFTQTIQVVNFGPCAVPNWAPFSTDQMGNIVLSWNSVRTGAQYEISYRKTGETNWTVLPLTNQTSVSLNNFERCVNYEVQHRSLCSGNYSAYSPPQIINFLGTPTITAIRYISQTACLLIWNPLPNARYRVQYRERGTVNWTSTPFNLTQPNRLIIGLKPKVPYEMRVLARCANDTSQNPPVNTSPTQTHPNTGTIFECNSNLPSPPLEIQALNVQSRRAVIRWRNINSGVGTLVTFGPTNTNPNFWSQVLVCNPTDSLVLNNLRPTTNYGFYLQTLCTNCINTDRRNKRSNRSILNEFRTLGTRENDAFSENRIENQHITVYPNPNKGHFNVEGAEGIIKLFDMTGRLVWFDEAKSERTEINGISPGLYFLKVNHQTIKILIEE